MVSNKINNSKLCNQNVHFAISFVSCIKQKTSRSHHIMIVNYKVSLPDGLKLYNVVQALIADPDAVLADIKAKYNAKSIRVTDATPGAKPQERIFRIALGTPVPHGMTSEFAGEFSWLVAKALGLPPGDVQVLEIAGGTTLTVKVAKNRTSLLAAAVGSFVSDPVPAMSGIMEKYNVINVAAMDATGFVTPNPAAEGGSVRGFAMAFNEDSDVSSSPTFAIEMSDAVALALGLPSSETVAVKRIKGSTVSAEIINNNTPLLQTTFAAFIAAPEAKLPSAFRQSYGITSVVAIETNAGMAEAEISRVLEATASTAAVRTFNIAFNSTDSGAGIPGSAFAMAAAQAMGLPMASPSVVTKSGGGTRSMSVEANAEASIVASFTAAPLTSLPASFKQSYDIRSAMAIDTTSATIAENAMSAAYPPRTRFIEVCLAGGGWARTPPLSFVADFASSLASSLESVKVLGFASNGVVKIQADGGDVRTFVRAPLSSVPPAVKSLYGLTIAVARETTLPPYSANIAPSVVVPPPSVRTFTIIFHQITITDVDAFKTEFAREATMAMGVAVSNVSYSAEAVSRRTTVSATASHPADPEKLAAEVSAFTEAPVAAFSPMFTQSYGITLAVASDTTVGVVVTPPPSSSSSNNVVNPTSQVRTFALAINTPISPKTKRRVLKSDFEAALAFPTPSVATYLDINENRKVITVQVVNPDVESLLATFSSFTANPLLYLSDAFKEKYSVSVALATDTTTVNTTVVQVKEDDEDLVPPGDVLNFLPGSYAPISDAVFNLSSLQQTSTDRWVFNSDISIVYSQEERQYQLVCNNPMCITLNIPSFVTSPPIPIVFGIKQLGLRRGLVSVKNEVLAVKANLTLYVEASDVITVAFSSPVPFQLTSGYAAIGITHALSQWDASVKLLSVVACSYDNNPDTTGVGDVFSFNTRGLALEAGFTDRWMLDVDFYLRNNEIVSKTTKTITISIESVNVTNPDVNIKIKIAHRGVRNGGAVPREILEGFITPVRTSSYTAYVQPNDSLLVSFDEIGSTLNVTRCRLNFVVRDDYVLSANSWTTASPNKTLAVVPQLYDDIDSTADVVSTFKYRTDDAALGLLVKLDDNTWRLDDDFNIRNDGFLGHELVAKSTKILTVSMQKILTNLGLGLNHSIKVQQRGTRNLKPWADQPYVVKGSNASIKLYVMNNDTVSIGLLMEEDRTQPVYVYDAAVTFHVENIASSWTTDSLAVLQQFYDNNPASINVTDGLLFVTQGLAQLSTTEWLLDTDFTLKFDAERMCHVIVCKADKTVTATVSRSLPLASFELAHWGTRNGALKKISGGLKTLNGAHVMLVRRDDEIIVSVTNVPNGAIYLQDVRISFRTTFYSPSVTTWTENSKLIGITTKFYDNLVDTATILPLLTYNIPATGSVLDANFDLQADRVLCKAANIITVGLKDGRVMTDNPENDALTKVLVTQKGVRNVGESASVLTSTEIWGSKTTTMVVRDGDVIESSLSAGNASTSIYVYDACLSLLVKNDYTFTSSSVWETSMSVKPQVYDNILESSSRKPTLAFNTSGLIVGGAANSWTLDSAFKLLLDANLQGHKIVYDPPAPAASPPKAVTIAISTLFTENGMNDDAAMFVVNHVGVRNGTLRTIATPIFKRGATPPTVYLQPGDMFTISLDSSTLSLNIYDAVFRFNVSEITISASWTPTSKQLSVNPQFYDYFNPALEFNTTGLTTLIQGQQWALDQDFTLRNGRELVCNTKKILSVYIRTLKTSKAIDDTTTQIHVVQTGSVRLAIPMYKGGAHYKFYVQENDGITFNFVPGFSSDEIYVFDCVVEFAVLNNNLAMLNPKTEMALVPEFKSYAPHANLTFDGLIIQNKDFSLRNDSQEIVYMGGNSINVKFLREVLTTNVAVDDTSDSNFGVLVTFPPDYTTRLFPFNGIKPVAFDIVPLTSFSIKSLENRSINQARFKLIVSDPITSKVVVKIAPDSYAMGTDLVFDTNKFDMGNDFVTSVSKNALTYGGWQGFSGFNQKVRINIDTLYTTGKPVDMLTAISVKKQTTQGHTDAPIPLKGNDVATTSVRTGDRLSFSTTTTGSPVNIINATFYLALEPFVTTLSNPPPIQLKTDMVTLDAKEYFRIPDISTTPITYSFVSNPYDASLDLITGNVTITGANRNIRYDIVIKATDTQSNFDNATISVIELAPPVTLRQNVAIPTVTLGNDSTTIPLSDFFNNYTLSPLEFSILPPNLENNASINKANGTLTIIGEYRNKPYNVQVQAKDINEYTASITFPVVELAPPVAVNSEAIITTTNLGNDSKTFVLTNYFINYATKYALVFDFYQNGNPEGSAQIENGVLMITGAFRNADYNVIVKATDVNRKSAAVTFPVSETVAPLVRDASMVVVSTTLSVRNNNIATLSLSEYFINSSQAALSFAFLPNGNPYGSGAINSLTGVLTIIGSNRGARYDLRIEARDIKLNTALVTFPVEELTRPVDLKTSAVILPITLRRDSLNTVTFTLNQYFNNYTLSPLRFSIIHNPESSAELESSIGVLSVVGNDRNKPYNIVVRARDVNDFTADVTFPIVELEAPVKLRSNVSLDTSVLTYDNLIRAFTLNDFFINNSTSTPLKYVIDMNPENNATIVEATGVLTVQGANRAKEYNVVVTAKDANQYTAQVTLPIKELSLPVVRNTNVVINTTTLRSDFSTFVLGDYFINYVPGKTLDYVFADGGNPDNSAEINDAKTVLKITGAFRNKRYDVVIKAIDDNEYTDTATFPVLELPSGVTLDASKTITTTTLTLENNIGVFLLNEYFLNRTTSPLEFSFDTNGNPRQNATINGTTLTVTWMNNTAPYNVLIVARDVNSYTATATIPLVEAPRPVSLSSNQISPISTGNTRTETPLSGYFITATTLTFAFEPPNGNPENSAELDNARGALYVTGSYRNKTYNVIVRATDTYQNSVLLTLPVKESAAPVSRRGTIPDQPLTNNIVTIPMPHYFNNSNLINMLSPASKPFLSQTTNVQIYHPSDGRTVKLDEQSGILRLNTGAEISFDVYSGSDVYNATNRVALFVNGSNALSMRHKMSIVRADPFVANNYDFAWSIINNNNGTVDFHNPYSSGFFLGYDSAYDRLYIATAMDVKRISWKVAQPLTYNISRNPENSATLSPRGTLTITGSYRKKTYTVTVNATDPNGVTDADQSISVTETAPPVQVYNTPYRVTLSNEAQTFTFSDYVEHFTASITYAFVSDGNPEGNAEINNTLGTLTVTGNFRNKPYNVNVLATDANRNTVVVTFPIVERAQPVTKRGTIPDLTLRNNTVSISMPLYFNNYGLINPSTSKPYFPEDVQIQLYHPTDGRTVKLDGNVLRLNAGDEVTFAVYKEADVNNSSTNVALFANGASSLSLNHASFVVQTSPFGTGAQFAWRAVVADAVNQTVDFFNAWAATYTLGYDSANDRLFINQGSTDTKRLSWKVAKPLTYSLDPRAIHTITKDGTLSLTGNFRNTTYDVIVTATDENNQTAQQTLNVTEIARPVERNLENEIALTTLRDNNVAIELNPYFFNYAGAKGPLRFRLMTTSTNPEQNASIVQATGVLNIQGKNRKSEYTVVVEATDYNDYTASAAFPVKELAPPVTVKSGITIATFQLKNQPVVIPLNGYFNNYTDSALAYTATTDPYFNTSINGTEGSITILGNYRNKIYSVQVRATDENLYTASITLPVDEYAAPVSVRGSVSPVKLNNLLRFNIPMPHYFNNVHLVNKNALSTKPYIPASISRIQIYHPTDGRTVKLDGNIFRLNTGNEVDFSIYTGADVYDSVTRIALFANGSNATAFSHNNFVVRTDPFAANNLNFAWSLVWNSANDTADITNPYGGGYSLGYDSTNDQLYIVTNVDSKKLSWKVARPFTYVATPTKSFYSITTRGTLTINPNYRNTTYTITVTAQDPDNGTDATNVSITETARPVDVRGTVPNQENLTDNVVKIPLPHYFNNYNLINTTTSKPYLLQTTNIQIYHPTDGRTIKIGSNNVLRFNSGDEVFFDINSRSDVYQSDTFSAFYANGSSSLSLRHANYVIRTDPFVANNYDFAWKVIDRGDGTVDVFNAMGSGLYMGYDSSSDTFYAVGSTDAKRMSYKCTKPLTYAIKANPQTSATFPLFNGFNRGTLAIAGNYRNTNYTVVVTATDPESNPVDQSIYVTEKANRVTANGVISNQYLANNTVKIPLPHYFNNYFYISATSSTPYLSQTTNFQLYHPIDGRTVKLDGSVLRLNTGEEISFDIYTGADVSGAATNVALFVNGSRTLSLNHNNFVALANSFATSSANHAWRFVANASDRTVTIYNASASTYLLGYDSANDRLSINVATPVFSWKVAKPLTYTVTSDPQSSATTTSKGTLSIVGAYRGGNPYTVAVKATDPDSNFATQNISVTEISSTPKIPLMVSSLSTLQNGSLVSLWDNFARSSIGTPPYYYSSGGYNNQPYVQFNTTSNLVYNSSLMYHVQFGFTFIGLICLTGTPSSYNTFFYIDNAYNDDVIAFGPPYPNPITYHIRFTFMSNPVDLITLIPLSSIPLNTWNILVCMYDNVSRKISIKIQNLTNQKSITSIREEGSYIDLYRTVYITVPLIIQKFALGYLNSNDISFQYKSGGMFFYERGLTDAEIIAAANKLIAGPVRVNTATTIPTTTLGTNSSSFTLNNYFINYGSINLTFAFNDGSINGPKNNATIDNTTGILVVYGNYRGETYNIEVKATDSNGFSEKVSFPITEYSPPRIYGISMKENFSIQYLLDNTVTFQLSNYYFNYQYLQPSTSRPFFVTENSNVPTFQIFHPTSGKSIKLTNGSFSIDNGNEVAFNISTRTDVYSNDTCISIHLESSTPLNSNTMYLKYSNTGYSFLNALLSSFVASDANFAWKIKHNVDGTVDISSADMTLFLGYDPLFQSVCFVGPTDPNKLSWRFAKAHTYSLSSNPYYSAFTSRRGTLTISGACRATDYPITLSIQDYNNNVATTNVLIKEGTRITTSTWYQYGNIFTNKIYTPEYLTTGYLRLTALNTFSTCNAIYYRNFIQKAVGFQISCQISATYATYTNATADAIWFFCGATDVVQLEGYTNVNGGYQVAFDVYGNPGTYLYNSTNSANSVSSTYAGTGSWQEVLITYKKSITNTWTVALDGTQKISYNDPNNASWLTSSGDFWGFGARTGDTTCEFCVRNINLSIEGFYPNYTNIINTNAKAFSFISMPGGSRTLLDYLQSFGVTTTSSNVGSGSWNTSYSGNIPYLESPIKTINYFTQYGRVRVIEGDGSSDALDWVIFNFGNVGNGDYDGYAEKPGSAYFGGENTKSGGTNGQNVTVGYVWGFNGYWTLLYQLPLPGTSTYNHSNGYWLVAGGAVTSGNGKRAEFDNAYITLLGFSVS